ncbi:MULTISPECIES: DUF4232 domain-containing protein [unclassified Streptomyces]|uniref:DUF4232 domain-containing protein n=1 Tax=unclassified Streptomyces TaxID=2593676 RepID=UPI002E2E74B8|nr:DUF4232 domain-containing protein [Streptomyces sp. NBC_00223]
MGRRLVTGVLGVALAATAGCGTATEGAGPGAVGPVPDVRVKADPLPSDLRGLERYGDLPSTAPTAPATAPVCPAAGLWLTADEPDAAMGLRAMSVHLTNCGTKSRTVSGYPALRVLDGDGGTLPVTVHRGISVTTGIDDPAPTRLTLAPGQGALAVLAWRNTVTDSTVVATNGAAIEVVPAPGAAAQSVPVLVDLGNTGTLDVTAWRCG